MATQYYNIPIIDISKATTHRKDLAKRLVSALEGDGFFFVDGIDIDFEKIYRSCTWFFGQPESEKLKLMKNYWNPKNENMYRGYASLVDNTRRETFDTAKDIPDGLFGDKDTKWFYEKSVWPTEDGTFDFKPFIQSARETLHNTGMELLRLTALGMDIPEDTFVSMFTKAPCSTLRLAHYQAWVDGPPKNGVVEDGKLIKCPTHQDPNFMTFLNVFEHGGFQIKTQKGQFVDIEPRQKSFIVNIGEAFTRMLDGRFPNIPHRVIDIGLQRYLFVLFLEPTYDADVGEKILNKITGDGNDHVVEEYGDWTVTFRDYFNQYFQSMDLSKMQLGI